MGIVNYSLKGANGSGSGFILEPNPPVSDINYFTSEASRDAYFSANPTELAKYDANIQRLILMEAGGSICYENRFNNAWINAFGGSIGAIDLSQHNVEELANVTNAGSGIIMSVAERVKLGGITDLGSGAIITDEERTKLDDISNILELATTQTTNFTATWQTRQLVLNTANEVDITLPTATTADIGKTIEFLISSDPENYNILLLASDLDGVINTITSTGTEVAKARIMSFRKQFWALRVICVSENNYIIEEPDSVYSELMHKMFVNNTSSSVHNVFNMDSVIPNFLTDNDSWWFAIKFAGPLYNSSSTQTLFSTNNFGIGIRGNGSYLGTSGSSSFLIAMSPNRVPANGYWLVFTYSHISNNYSAWLNGSEVVKVVNNTTSGATPPITPGTRMDFGRDVETTEYMYGLMQFSTTCMMVGSGFLTDAQGAEFVYSVQNSDALTLTTPTNEWIPGATDFVTRIGTVDLTKDPVDNLDIEFHQL